MQIDVDAGGAGFFQLLLEVMRQAGLAEPALGYEEDTVVVPHFAGEFSDFIVAVGKVGAADDAAIFERVLLAMLSNVASNT